MASGLSAQAAAGALSPRARTLAFGTLIVAFVMDVLDSTIVNVAIPAIRADLGASAVAVQWMVAGYSTAFAMLLVSGGRLGDVFGYRRLFLIGMSGFTVASLLCGLAQDPTQLILARLLQGATAACMGPQVIAIVQLMFKPYERVRALSLFGLLGGVAAVAGPIVGGALIKADIAGLGWRLIFLINLPVGIVGIVAARRWLPAGTSPDPLRIDWTGNALGVAMLFAFVFPLVQGRAIGWPWWCLALLAATIPLAALLWRHLHKRTARNGSALIDPVLFGERSFSSALLTSLVFSTAAGGFFLILTLLLQVGLGLDPLSAGLVHVPLAFGISLGVGMLGRKILPRLGRSVLTAGAGAMLLGVLAFTALVATGGSVMAMGAALLAIGLGMGTCMGPLGPIALARVDGRHAGSAGGMLKTVQQLGTAAGAASIGTLFLVVAHGALDPTLTRAAFTPAAIAICALLLVVMLLSRRFPRHLFDV